jgi:geranylgeranyl diphosphate synthase type II
MSATERIERALWASMALVHGAGHPPRLAAAMQHAVFPGGARIRPKLVLAVAGACGDDDPALADACAAAVELLHCASLVHDDLPCFDDAAERRGLPSVQHLFGERMAVLAGDGLIVSAFQALASGAREHPTRLPGLLGTLCRGVGMPGGIVAGQAWESEPQVTLKDYQRAKTGALFAAATMAGALAAGGDVRPWGALGDRLGHAYQVADDIRDVLGDAALLGKPPGQDAARGSPSAARTHGLEGALAEFERLIAAALKAIPACHGANTFRALVQAEAERLMPLPLRAECLAVPA